jgi:hypothetical protein
MKLKFVKEDFWVGLYWKTSYEQLFSGVRGSWFTVRTRRFYLCLIPCFPITWERRKTTHEHTEFTGAFERSYGVDLWR